MTPIGVERGVPIPPKAVNRASREPKYPWKLLDVGDSFFVPGLTYVAICASAFKQRPLRFAVRTVEGGVRVWRVA